VQNDREVNVTKAQEENAVFIDGTELKESDMTDKQKYLVKQCQNLSHRKANLDLEADQVNAALNVFQNELIVSIKQVADEVLDKGSDNIKGDK